MKLNGISAIGLLVFVGGWLFLLFGIGVDTGIGSVANLHRLSIAQSMILSGIGMAILGAVVDLTDRKTPDLIAEAPTMQNAVTSPAESPSVASGVAVKTGEVDGRAYTIFDDGTVELSTLTGTKTFPNMAAALDYIGRN